MNSYVALLRAVNVGGTGKLAMADLKKLCEAAGLHDVRTYIASGNVVFRSALADRSIAEALDRQIQRFAGKSVGILVRTAADMAAVFASNPFPDAPGNRAVAIFLDVPVTSTILEGITGQNGETIRLGRREVYVRYDNGMANSRLQIPAATSGTARNMNTVARLAAMANDP